MKVRRLEGAKVKNSAEPSRESESECEWVLGAAGIGSAWSARLSVERE